MVGPDDIVRYIHGDVRDEAEVERIEAAIVGDPVLALAHEHFRKKLVPASRANGERQAKFERFNHSRFGRVEYRGRRAPGMDSSAYPTIGAAAPASNGANPRKTRLCDWTAATRC